MTTFDYILSILNVLGGIFISLGYIPQIVKTFRTKDVENFDPKYYGMIAFGVGVCFLTGLKIMIESGFSDVGLAVGQFLSLAVSSTMFTLYLCYKDGEKAKTPKAREWQRIYNEREGRKKQGDTI